MSEPRDIVSDQEIWRLWREAGGTSFGPRVEHACMEEQKFLAFMRKLYERVATAEAAGMERVLRMVQRYTAAALSGAGTADIATLQVIEARIRELILSVQSPSSVKSEIEGLRALLGDVRDLLDTIREVYGTADLLDELMFEGIKRIDSALSQDGSAGSSPTAGNAEIEGLRKALDEIRTDAFLLGTAINERDPYDELFVRVNDIMRHVNTALSSKEPTP